MSRGLRSKGKREGSGRHWELGVGRCTLLCFEWIGNEVLLYSTGNYIQSRGRDHDGSQYKKGDVYIYVRLRHFAAAEIGTTVYINYNLKVKKKKKRLGSHPAVQQLVEGPWTSSAWLGGLKVFKPEFPLWLSGNEPH